MDKGHNRRQSISKHFVYDIENMCGKKSLHSIMRFPKCLHVEDMNSKEYVIVTTSCGSEGQYFTNSQTNTEGKETKSMRKLYWDERTPTSP